MSSKAEKTSNHSCQQPRLSIFFRNPLLLKIVAWLGSLSFIGSTGIVWADLQPISTAKVEAQAVADASVPMTGTSARLASREVYGPYLPVAQPQSVRVSPNSSASTQQLPNREVPVAVTPGSAAILPTGTIVRPQHTDVLTADNYTVGVSSSTSALQYPEEFVNIPIPAPLSTTVPSQIREVAAQTRSQVRPNYLNPQSAIGQSVPTTGIQTKSPSPQSGTAHRSVPEVSNLPTLTSISPRSGSVSSTTPTSSVSAAGRTYSNPVRTTVLTPLKPATVPTSRVVTSVPVETISSVPVSSQNSVEIIVPAPRTQRIEVQPVARLPQVTAGKVVPTVSAIPSVRPATVGNMENSQQIAFTNNGENQSGLQLIYPLTSPVATTSGFGWRTHPITGSRRFHSGVDLGAPMGAPVVATGSGIVISSGWMGGYGKAIVIQHNGIQQTLYGHLSEVFVQPGQRIEQGMAIGRVGSTGNSTGPHLHYESRVSTSDGWVAIDPGEEIKYALDNLRRSMPFAQRELSPGIN
jgi:murein DD-endopeptidase MepM/ murein hydrolase activator NlpD